MFDKKLQIERAHQMMRARQLAGDLCETARLLNVLHDPAVADHNELDKLLADCQDLAGHAVRLDPEKERPEHG